MPREPRIAVVVLAADGRALVVVVRVVGADLHRLVRGAAQHRKQRVGELDEGFERDAREPRQVAVALGAVEGVPRRRRRAGRRRPRASARRRTRPRPCRRGCAARNRVRSWRASILAAPRWRTHVERSRRTSRPARRKALDGSRTAKDKDAWVANFADDGVVEDPIGPSIFDPEGKGHRGKAAIAAFWDKLIGPNRVFFDLRESFACGSECANVGSVQHRAAERRDHDRERRLHLPRGCAGQGARAARVLGDVAHEVRRPGFVSPPLRLARRAVARRAGANQAGIRSTSTRVPRSLHPGCCIITMGCRWKYPPASWIGLSGLGVSTWSELPILELKRLPGVVDDDLARLQRR